jgi:tetratricopeptide (TPR) repeat protein
MVSAEDIPAYTLYNDAVHFESTGQWQAARKTYEAALAMKNDLKEARQNLGNLVNLLGEEDVALAHHYTNLEMLPLTDIEFRAGALNNIGNILLKKAGKDYAGIMKANDVFREALAINPQHEGARYNYGLVMEKMGDLNGAKRQYEIVIAQSSYHTGALMNLGNIYLRWGLFEKAVSQYSQIVDAYGKGLGDMDVIQYTGVLNNMGQSYKEMGDPAAALQSHQQALALQPDDRWSANLAITARRTLCNWASVEDDIAQQVHDNLLEAAATSPLVGPRGEDTKVGVTPYDSTLMRSSATFHLLVARVASKPYDTITRVVLDDAVYASQEDGSAPLRVGFLSFDFRKHPMGQLTVGFLEQFAARAKKGKEVREGREGRRKGRS